MIDYAKKSDMACWKVKGNRFAGKYDSKSWGMAWIVEHIDLPSGMHVLDVGHSMNKEVAEFFFQKGCHLYAMDSISSDVYVEWFEQMGGIYIDRFCGLPEPEVEFKNKFDLVFSIGVLEHTVEWGYPMSVFPILNEMIQMLKIGGVIANVYEPTVFMDTPFNIRNDIAFLSESIEFFRSDCQNPASVTIPSMYEIATNPDTIISDAEITYADIKGRNGWTALGYIGRKIGNISTEKYIQHRDSSPNLLWARYGLNCQNKAQLASFPFNTYKKIMFWGGGSRFNQFYSQLMPYIKLESVKAIIDSNQEKWGMRIQDIPIVEPGACCNAKPDLIIITSVYYATIIMEIEKLKRQYHFDCDYVIV